MDRGFATAAACRDLGCFALAAVVISFVGGLIGFALFCFFYFMGWIA